jgi:DUF4097 and DUF4098 domain-containing protein YvlB
MKTRLSFLVLAVFFLFSFASVALTAEVDRHIQETAEVSEGMAFELEHGDGHVTITPWEKDEVSVDVRYHYEFSGIGVDEGDYDFSLDVTQRGNTLVIRGVEERPKRQLFANSDRHEYSYKISAPAYLLLDIQGDDGNVTIREWENNVSVQGDDGDFLLSSIKADRVDLSIGDGDMLVTGITANMDISGDDGEVELSQIRGDVNIEINDGDAELRDIQGSVTFSGDDGNFTLSNSTAENCRIDLNDGDVTIGQSSGNFTIDGDDARVRIDEVEAEQLNIDIGDADVWAYLLPASDTSVSIQTEDGDVELRLGDNVSADITLETDGGSIDQELTAITDLREGDGWFTGVLNGGEGNIRIETEDGDIHVQEGL